MSLVHLKHILGQQKAKKIIFRSLKEDRISHAYLFRGLDGIGKKTFALSFAAFLNCKNRSEDDFCGECPSCKKFASGNHPDYLDFTPESSTIKIAQIRELKKKLTFPPLEAEYRVILLPDIHHTMSRKEVSNSLLKTLEEPPANTVLILTADESGIVLPTILSRCQVILFAAISLADISGILSAKHEIAKPEAATFAALSGGSLGRALKLADGNMLALRRELLEIIYPLPLHEGVTIEKIMAIASQVSGFKEDIPAFFDLLRSWVRDMLFLCFGGKSQCLINQDLLPLYESVGARWNVSELFAKLDCLNVADRQLRHNCKRVSVCEMLFWELT